MYTNKAFDCVNSWLRNKDSINKITSLRIIQLNIRGMNDVSKFDCIGELLERYRKRVDIVVLGETWLKRDITMLYSLNGYVGIFSCRDDSHGGLVMYIRNDLHFNLCTNRCIDGFHHIHVTLQNKGKPLHLHAMYRPPSFDFRRFLSEIEHTITAKGSREAWSFLEI